MDLGAGNCAPLTLNAKFALSKTAVWAASNPLDETKERELGFLPLNKESEIPLYANAVYHSESVSGYGRATCSIGCEISVL